MMKIEYRDQKDLPCDELYKLFLAVGWAKDSILNMERQPEQAKRTEWG